MFIFIVLFLNLWLFYANVSLGESLKTVLDYTRRMFFVTQFMMVYMYPFLYYDLLMTTWMYMYSSEQPMS